MFKHGQRIKFPCLRKEKQLINRRRKKNEKGKGLFSLLCTRDRVTVKKYRRNDVLPTRFLDMNLGVDVWMDYDNTYGS